MIDLFHKPRKEKPPYLERIDIFEKLEIVRLKGRLDHEVIPIVEARIRENRSMGSTIEKNLLLDFALVDHVDSALIASHVLHLSEYQAKGLTIAFINVTTEWRALVGIFKENGEFKVFESEDEAIKFLNK
jgi:anti-anti-sigma regulatory factor